MPSTIQRSFAGGEISPALYGRADQAKYTTGLRTCRNFMVQRFGGITNRPGTEFVCEVKTSSLTVRLLRFRFNDSQTYILEFGNLYMRVIREGVQVESSPGVAYELATPYVTADLSELQYVQSGDVVTIVHPNYAPRDLSRTSHTSWTLAVTTFAPSLNGPAVLASTVGAAGTNTYRYRVTSIKSETLEESLPGYGIGKTVTAATQANPCALTVVGHGYTTGDEIAIAAVAGMTQLNGQVVIITVTGANTFTLNGVNSTAYGAFVFDGLATVARTHATSAASAAPTSAAPNVITWDAVADAQEYNVYLEINGVYGFIGIAGSTTFSDIGYVPDLSDTTGGAPPESRTPFVGADNYPSAVGYFQQRRLYANTNNDPEKVWTSKSGNYTNLTSSSPTQDDDAITFTIAGREVNEVRHLIDLGKLVLLTEGGEWVAGGDGEGVLRPGSINLRQQGYDGAASIRPVTIGNSVLYIQARGTIVRDLRYDFESDGYAGKDLTIFAGHLFEGETVADWDYQKIPHSVVWAALSDGSLAALTYVREHEVWGWHRHDTQGGFFENVCSVPEGEEDGVYFVVRRTIAGVTKRYIERLHSRQIFNIERDAFFVDSGLTYDGWNETATTMTLSGGVTWAYTEPLTLTASVATFLVGDVGNEFFLERDGLRLRCLVTGYTSTTVVTVTAHRDVIGDYIGFRSVAISDWARAVDSLSGLSHLNGQTVSILGDGNVLTPAVVTAGAITLSTPRACIHVGLPIEADAETLDMETTVAETLADKRKLVASVTVMLEGSRGGWAGIDEDHLDEMSYSTTDPFTGKHEIRLNSKWNDNGRVFIRQSDPLPMTILAIVPRGAVGG